jgi:hypothetical protein
MSNPKEITNALLTVEASAAHLERIGQSQEEELRRLLFEIAQNLRLLAGIIRKPNEIGIECGNVAA